MAPASFERRIARTPPGPQYTTQVHRLEGLGRSEVQAAESVSEGAARSAEGLPIVAIGLADAALGGGQDDGGGAAGRGLW